jgi:hypothetical protein
MRPELANALVETGLVDSANDGLAMVDVDIHAISYAAIEDVENLFNISCVNAIKRWLQQKSICLESCLRNLRF